MQDLKNCDLSIYDERLGGWCILFNWNV